MTVRTSSAADRPVALPVTVHATGVVIGETGVLILGASGAGKSRLALALIEACVREGLNARLVGDDRMVLRVAGGRIVAAGHPRIAGRIEQRGEGILSVAFEPSAVLHCIINLIDEAPGCGDLPRWPDSECENMALEGVHLPVCRLTTRRFGLPELAQALRFVRRNGPQNGK